jgi:cellulose synthase/poly-beta-1,6-N-acetylglucosamine synthase-like glycosyltransferase
MISIIITAKKEPVTLAKAIKSIVRPFYSGVPEDFELIQISPDQETLESGKLTLENEKWSKDNYVQIKDPGKGKPHALNLGLNKAKGDIIILTDGDVYFDKDAITHLISEFHDPKVGGVTGRPVATNSRSSMMGYWAHLLADAAHHKRIVSMRGENTGKSKMFVSENEFFPLSGYIMAIRNVGINLPEDILVDDAYISYLLKNKGYKLAYKPESKVFVKYADSLSDYFKQKKRSLGGYVQLWKYGIVTEDTKARSFWHEIEYFWFPIKYSNNLKEFFWSLFLYPVRLVTWILIWWERKILNKNFEKTWVRVESTK